MHEAVIVAPCTCILYHVISVIGYFEMYIENIFCFSVMRNLMDINYYICHFVDVVNNLLQKQKNTADPPENGKPAVSE